MFQPLQIMWIQKRKWALFLCQGPLNCLIIIGCIHLPEWQTNWTATNCVVNIFILNIWAFLMRNGALLPQCIITFHFLSLQKGIHIHGGLEKPMRSTTTGEDQDLVFKNVPVALNATVLIPSTTATVMLIISNGECSTRKQTTRIS